MDKNTKDFFKILKAYTVVVLLVSVLLTFILLAEEVNAGVLPKTVRYVMPTVLTGSNTGDLEQQLRDLTENDTLIVEFAGFGGVAYQGLKIMGLIEGTKANVTCEIVGPVYSMHAYLPFSCPKLKISKHAFFMFHSVQGEYDTKQIAMYNRMLMKNLIGILTNEEIQSMLKDNYFNVYITGEDMLKRINK